MRPFSLLVKPASADCNLRCKYCFYFKKCGLYPNSKTHRMTQSTLEKMLSSYMQTRQPQYAIGWQGGEPTLMGLDFFKEVVKLQQRYGRAGTLVANGLQTNGILIDNEFARHLAKYNFLIGVSLDGPQELHDLYRHNPAGSGSFTAVRRGIKALQQAEAEFNILVLVSKANVKQAKNVYHFLCENGFYYHQYIPCVEFDASGKLLPFAINGDEWGTFLCELYDSWRQNDTRKISIRHFDSVLSLMVDNIRNVCVIGDNCCQYLVVEHNGDIYPCDFFVEEELKLGNIHNSSWKDLLESPVYAQFGAKKSQLNQKCTNCQDLDLCAGDCLKHRLTDQKDPHILSILCSGWEKFYQHTRAGFASLATEIRAERKAQQQIGKRLQPSPQKTPPGRNSPCPCGSGAKFKKCCGRK